MSGEPPKKIRKIGTTTENSVGDLDKATLRNLELVDVCQIEIDNLNLKASEEILKIELKYNVHRKPHFAKRSEVIKNIPNFWFSAIMHHPDLRLIIDEREEECLQFLTAVEMVEFDDIKSGYRLEFHFEENPFFENTILTKEFNLDGAIPNSQSTPIKWKDVDLTKYNESKPGHKKCFESRSFFGWFMDNVDPLSDDIAEIIKDDLWQNPLHYYLVPDADENNAVENDEETESSGDGDADDTQED